MTATTPRYSILRDGILIALGCTEREARSMVRFEMRRYPKAVYQIVATIL